MTTQDRELTVEQIQGRLNQREINWKAALVSDNDAAVMFTPKDGKGASTAMTG